MSENENEREQERDRGGVAGGEGGRKRGILGKLIFIIVIYLVNLLLPIKSKGM